MVEQVIPMTVIIVLSVLLVLVQKVFKWVHTTRDVMIVLFSGFMAAFLVLTIVGTFFRGEGQNLVPPWDVPVHPDGA